MENKVPPVVVKQEPPDEDKEVVEMNETVLTVKSENDTESCDLKIQKGIKKTHSTGKSFDAKRIKKETQPFSLKEGKVRKTSDGEVETCVEPPRPGVFPYRTKSDFCCTICNAHMNSIQMWESHIRGKRHLKNSKKGSIAAVPAVAPVAPVQIKKEKVDDVAGLYYIDTQGAQSPPRDTVIYERRPESPGDSKPKEYHSPEPASPSVAAATSSVETLNFSDINMTMTDKINYILKLSSSVYPHNESDYNEIKSIMAALTQSILQYEIRQLPLAAQQKLAKELFRGN